MKKAIRTGKTRIVLFREIQRKCSFFCEAKRIRTSNKNASRD